jgi:REP element-mobilizing transposase RayT
MIRGIEGRRIFFGRADRLDFLERLDRLLPELGFHCFGWVLMPNHVHLLVRSGVVRLSRLMARLETGYARSFNLRHQRAGYLFQNRFRSRIVSGDADLLAVVGYLYRNPLAAGIVASVAELARWPWSGFSALAGTRAPRPFENVRMTLTLFDPEPEAARRNLLEYVLRGEPAEANPPSPTQAFRLAPESTPDESPLTQHMNWLGSVSRPDEPADVRLRTLIEAVCREQILDPAALRARSRPRAVSAVRAIISYQAVVQLRIPGLAVAKALGISPSAVSHAIERGRALCTENPEKPQRLGDL